MKLDDVAERLRRAALAFPETYEEAPWGDRVVKVKGKIFYFCGVRDGELCVSAKLPESNRAALTLPFVAPTGYGLGKSGWVTATVKECSAQIATTLEGWARESYRALAPKKLVALLDGETAKPASEKTSTATPKPPQKISKRVLLISHDELRAARAIDAYAAHGLRLLRAVDKPDAVIIDLGRQAKDGLAMATELDDSDLEVAIFLVGVKDAASRRKAKDLASAEVFAAEPGDPDVVAAIIAALRPKPRAKPRR